MMIKAIVESGYLAKKVSITSPSSLLYAAFATAPPKPILPGQKKAFVRDKPHMNIGTIGHVDHGKTTLTAAITRVLAKQKLSTFKSYTEIDNAPEEQKRGITINAATIDYSTAKRHYGHTDCPGHADYIKNMITGANQMECAVLVVAATDGTMPQTKEHLLLAKQIGIENLIVYINKADVADSEMLELVELEIRDVLKGYGFDGDNTPVVTGSALSALEGKDEGIGEESILKLLEHIDNCPMPARDVDKPFSLPIETIHSITGRGTVATGRIERGIIKPNDPVDIMGYGKHVKSVVTGVEMFRQLLEKGEPGDSVGLLLRGVKREDLRRGMVIAASKTATMHNHAQAQIYLLSKEEGGRQKPFLNGNQFHVFCKSWNIQSALMFKDREMIMPGEDATVDINFMREMIVVPGDRFTIRSDGKTTGYGVITKALPFLETDRWVM